jgi:hypothetical protein
MVVGDSSAQFAATGLLRGAVSIGIGMGTLSIGIVLFVLSVVRVWAGAALALKWTEAKNRFEFISVKMATRSPRQDPRHPLLFDYLIICFDYFACERWVQDQKVQSSSVQRALPLTKTRGRVRNAARTTDLLCLLHYPAKKTYLGKLRRGSSSFPRDCPVYRQQHDALLRVGRHFQTNEFYPNLNFLHLFLVKFTRTTAQAGSSSAHTLATHLGRNEKLV